MPLWRPRPLLCSEKQKSRSRAPSKRTSRQLQVIKRGRARCKVHDLYFPTHCRTPSSSYSINIATTKRAGPIYSTTVIFHSGAPPSPGAFRVSPLQIAKNSYHLFGCYFAQSADPIRENIDSKIFSEVHPNSKKSKQKACIILKLRKDKVAHYDL